MDPVTLIVGGAVALFLLAGLTRPSLFGAMHIRWLGFLRFWEKKMVQSKEGYAAIKDAKKELLQKREGEVLDELATVRSKRENLNDQLAASQRDEDQLNATRETILQSAAAANANPGTPEFEKFAADLQAVETAIAKIDAKQGTLNQLMAELQREVEEMAPYLDQIESDIARTEMEKELGQIKLDVAQIKKDKARRMGLLVGGKESYVDRLERDADEFVRKEIETGKVAEERAGGTAKGVVEKYQQRTAAKTAGERLAAELASRQKATAPATHETAKPETLTR